MYLKRTLPVLLMMALVGGVAACSDPDQRESKYMHRGIELFNQGDYQKARLEFRNAAGIKPTDPEVRYRLGLIDEAEGDLRNAFANFSHAVEQDVHYRPAQLKIAQYYLSAEQFEQVEDHLNVVLADQPENAEAHAMRAALALRHQNYDETEREARFALQQEPGNVTAVSVLVGLYVAKDDKASAAEVLKSGMLLNPSSIPLLALKIAVYRQLNDVPKVEEAYRAIFALKPQERGYRLELADYYVTLNRLNDAETVLRETVAARPDDWDMKRKLVLFLNDHRGLDVAEKQVRALMAAAPNNNDLFLWLADLYVKHQAVDRAVALLEEVATKERFDPMGLNARTSLARISFAQGDRELAKKLVAIVLEKAPANRDALFMRAGMEFDEGHYEAAVSDLRSILRDQPRAKDALQLLAESLARQGHLDLVIETLNQLLDIDPLNSAARVRLAQMYYLNGDAKHAMTLLDLVTKGQPTYSVGWESTARIATETKDWPTADHAIAKLAALDGQKLTADYLHGMVLAGQGKHEDAASQLAEVIRAAPSSALAEHALTALLVSDRALNRTENACGFIETLQSDSPFVTTALAECYGELGRPDEAAAAFDKVIASHAVRPEPYLGRARLYLAQHDSEKAMESLRLGMAAVPANIQLPLMLAKLLEEGGRYGEAVEVYDDLLGRNPTLNVAANNMAELIADYQYADPAALEKARQVAERFQGASNPLQLDTLGWVYYRQGNLTQALVTLERAVAAGEVPAQVRYHYGAVLSKLNRKDESKEQLEKATSSKENYVGIEDAKKILQSL